MRAVIVGTAGHIDHGKTALVRALTGTDTDRLPEEKKRGITIDLGFAELDLGDVHLGFVDVPGHERFVRNMLAGAHGIDLVMLVVAADEGVMPQTREHFDICRLLGIKSGLVVISKSDLVEDDLLALVREEVEDLVRGSFLDGAPIIAASALTGEGLVQLKNELRRIALKLESRRSHLVMRLPIDRVFTVHGFGTVVTGTLIAGSLHVADEVELLPAATRVRVRGLQVHGRRVEQAEAGWRTAVNLSGVEAASLRRGMTLVPAGRLRATRAFDAWIEVLEGGGPLVTRANVHVHIGAAETSARVRVLEPTGRIEPRAGGFAQFLLAEPVVALPEDRFIVRSVAPARTIAGGFVIDAHPPKHRGREKATARERLQHWIEADGTERFLSMVEAAGERGISRTDVLARTGWTDDFLTEILDQDRTRHAVVLAEDLFISRRQLNSLVERLTSVVEDFHLREPLARGLAREELREKVMARAPSEIFRAALAEAERLGRLVGEKELVRAATHRIELSAEEAALRDAFEAIFRRAGLEALTADEALARARVVGRAHEQRARRLIKLLLDAGTLVQLNQGLIIHRDAARDLLTSLQTYKRHHGATISVPAFKELVGVSRKYAIPLLEYLDRQAVTRREGDLRRLLL